MNALPRHPWNTDFTWVDHTRPATHRDLQTARDRQFPVVVDGVRPSSGWSASNTLRWSNT